MVAICPAYLSLDPGVLDEHASIGGEATHGASNVRVNFKYLFHATGDDEGGGETLFNGKDNAVLGLYSNGC